jgi:hypothetical protein
MISVSCLKVLGQITHAMVQMEHWLNKVHTVNESTESHHKDVSLTSFAEKVGVSSNGQFSVPEEPAGHTVPISLINDTVNVNTVFAVMAELAYPPIMR